MAPITTSLQSKLGFAQAYCDCSLEQRERIEAIIEAYEWNGAEDEAFYSELDDRFESVDAFDRITFESVIDFLQEQGYYDVAEKMATWLSTR